ncbi:hypothetical protein DRI50_02625 [candidate division KSB1 bacterium]|jgi:hypothetical protein|nr:MAG: hypothetical protein DRI50_02625 [candidate division KSB1 bacterium]
MRYFMIVLIALTASLVFGKDNDTRVLNLDSQGITTLKADCGAGFLKINGSPSAEQIMVTANIRPKGLNSKKLAKVVELNLKRVGSTAVLVSRAKNANHDLFDWIFGGNSDNIEIDLTIEIPQNLNLKITDGSGSTEIKSVHGKVEITDGSGSLTISKITGPLHITDGSGSILIQDIKGDCQINDGSGSMTLEHITGNVDITDGSGGILVNHVDGAIEIVDGSGEINLDHVTQTVTVRDGSGDINASNVNGDLVIKSAGSGRVFTNHIRGRIIGLHK